MTMLTQNIQTLGVRGRKLKRELAELLRDIDTLDRAGGIVDLTEGQEAEAVARLETRMDDIAAQFDNLKAARESKEVLNDGGASARRAG